ncbi:MAG: hypothetical protein ACRD4P_01725, partial [Bryobacteraceae bacterium]
MKFLAALLCGVVLASGADLERKSTIQRSFSLTANGSRRLDVDNLRGFIHVSGTSGAAIEMTAYETVRAKTSDEADEATHKVTLEISQNENAVTLYVDGPWRNRHWESRDRDYNVEFDFDVKVPAGTELELSTVTDGGIEAKNTAGDFDLKNVNGEIDLVDVSGSGQVTTVNGPIRASFVRNPRGGCSFRTINGPIEMQVQPGLSADLRFKTFQGGVYTDFPVSALPRLAATA